MPANSRWDLIRRLRVKRQKGRYTPTHPSVKRTVTKAFTILTSSAAPAASADDECRNFGTFIANKVRNYLPRTRNKVQQEISRIIIAAGQGLFDVPYLSPLRHQHSRFRFSPLLPLLLVQKT